jgi:hypothetical protein
MVLHQRRCLLSFPVGPTHPSRQSPTSFIYNSMHPPGGPDKKHNRLAPSTKASIPTHKTPVPMFLSQETDAPSFSWQQHQYAAACAVDHSLTYCACLHLAPEFRDLTNSLATSPGNPCRERAHWPESTLAPPWSKDGGARHT